MKTAVYSDVASCCTAQIHGLLGGTRYSHLTSLRNVSRFIQKILGVNTPPPPPPPSRFGYQAWGIEKK